MSITIEPFSCNPELVQQAHELIQRQLLEQQPPAPNPAVPYEASYCWHNSSFLLAINAARDRVLGLLGYGPGVDPESGQEVLYTNVLYVDPDFRRRHIAQMLAGALAQHAIEKGRHGILFALSADQPAEERERICRIFGDAAQVGDYKRRTVFPGREETRHQMGYESVYANLAVFRADAPSVTARTLQRLEGAPPEGIIIAHKGE